ncbi:MAG TPA: Ig domain-containing protein, partial [Thermoanaerobaculia bacterium]|nr:Ig domain-containing protein [Thermoanaerobaculia bacterium]
MRSGESMGRRFLLVVMCVLALSVAGQALAQAGCPSNSQAAQAITPNGATFPNGSVLTYRWSQATISVSGYRAEVSNDGGRSFTTACTATGTTTTQCIADDKIVGIGDYEWRVRTIPTGFFCPNGTASTTKTFTICDNITITPTSLNPTVIGATVNERFDATGGAGGYQWALSSGALPDGVTLSSAGELTGEPKESGNFNFTVRATDSKGCAGFRNLTLKVCPIITLSPNTLPNGTQGVAYSQTLSASGGTAPYTFNNITVFPLPPGLFISNGVLTGTPTTPGTYNSIIRATDANGCAESKLYSIHIDCPTITIGPNSLPGATQNTNYSQQLTATGGTSPFTFSLVDGTLPDRLTLGTDGKLSGILTTSGNFAFVVKVTDANGCSSTKSYTLAISEPCNLFIGPASLPSATKGVSYSQQLTATGGSDPYTFAQTGGTALPAGMSLSSEGKFSGTPTQSGSFAFEVRVTDAKGCVNTRSFTLVVNAQQNCPEAPTLISPINSETVFTGTVQLKWNAAANATIYEVFAGFNGATPSSVATTTNTFLNVSVSSAGFITWYVRASVSGNTICSPKDSATERFIVVKECKNDKPSLESPADGAEVTLPATFSWGSVSGASGYKLFVDASLVGTTTSSTKFVTSSISSGKHDWYVQALFEGCEPTESNHRTVTIATQNNCPTDKTTLLAPKNGDTVDNPIKFQWNAVKGAEKYRLVVSVDGGSSTTIALTDATEFEVKMPGSSVEWWVDVISEGTCPSISSEHFRFTLARASTCPTNPGVATPIAPANGATNLSTPVTFQWSPVSGATLYRVIGTITTATDSSTSVLGSTTSTSLTLSIPAGTVVWLVETLFGDDCPTTISSRFTFTVTTGSECKNGAPSLVQPPNGATNVPSPVLFRWNAVANAKSYRLFIATGNSGDFSFAGEGTTTEVTKIVPEGVVRWFVTAVFSGCPETRSNVFEFTAIETKPCPDGSIDRKSPADGSTQTSPVTFSWSALAGVNVYRLWASLDGGAFGLIAQTSSTSVTLNVPSGEVEWYVEGTRENCPSVVSSHGRFTVPRATNCNDNKPVTLNSPVSPGNEPVVVTSPVKFVWNAAANAIAYRLWVVPTGKAPVDLGITKDTHLDRELPAGIYAWFVDALFDGCPPVSSLRATFKINETQPRCGTDTPSLISPANNEVVTSPITFLWSSVTDAIEYRVFISTDGAAPVLIGTTTETTLTKSLSPGRIVWAVEAVFKSCPSTVSSRFTFTIPKQQNCSDEKPQLIAPADNATEDATVNFVWNPVSGAVRYVLVLRRGNDVPTPVGDTTATQLELKLPPSRYEWMVIAFFAGCPPVESARFHFNIPAPPECDNRRPLLLGPQDGAQVTPPVHLEWTPVPKAKSYKVWAIHENGDRDLLASTTASETTVDIPPGPYRWFVEVFFDNCPSLESARSEFFVLATPPPCRPPDKPVVNVVGQALSGTPYRVRWTPLPFVSTYELQEATALDFSNAKTITTEDVSAQFTHTAGDTPVQYLYRVRGVSPCSDERGPYSDVAGVFVVNPKSTAPNKNASAELGIQSNIVQSLFLPGTNPPVQFHAEVDKPWLKVSPSDGTLGADGITLIVTADPNVLVLGTNTGTVKITYTGAGKGQTTNATSLPSSVPVSVSLVTPVSPGGKNTPIPDSLIIPAVAHAQGANDSLFESDVRITNLAPEAQQYLINFTPSGVDGTVSGSSTFLEIEAGATTALDDILASFFTSGTTGMVEIRPLSATTSTTSIVNGIPSVELTTAAASRTYNVTPNGTFGQFIPAIRFADFIEKTTDGS